MKKSRLNVLLHIFIPLLVILISVKVIMPASTSSAFTSETTSYLDEKRSTVMEITAASTAASAAITLIPGDTGTPIAEKLADISGYSVILLCAILLEKYLAVFTGYVSFGGILPLAMILCIADYLFFRSPAVKKAVIRLSLYAVLLSSVIPLSVRTSQMIESTYRDSIQETIDNARESAQEIQDNTSGTEGNDTLWNKFISKIEGGVSTVTEKFEGILNDFTEAIAIMLVTSCLIPLLVFWLLIWITKQLTLNYEFRPLNLEFHH